MQKFHKTNVGDNSPSGARTENLLYLEDILKESIPKDAETINIDGCSAMIWDSHNGDLRMAIDGIDSEDPGAVQHGYVVVYQCDWIQDIDGYIYIPDAV